MANSLHTSTGMRHLIVRLAVGLVVSFVIDATPGFAQVGPCGVATGPLLPDLIVDQTLMETQIYVSDEQVNAKSCNIAEGSLSQAGNHVLVRFMSSTPNVGQTALNIGDPNQCPGMFQFADCHQHFHFMQYADYRLWTEEGYANWVANRDLREPTNSGHNKELLDAATASGRLLNGRKIGGHKQGFCMADMAMYPTDTIVPGPAVFRSCGTSQGISVGWADQYAPYLDGQFVEITGVPDGVYVLEDHVNPWHLLPETDYTNNSSAIRFRYTSKHGNVAPTIQIVR